MPCCREWYQMNTNCIAGSKPPIIRIELRLNCPTKISDRFPYFEKGSQRGFLNACNKRSIPKGTQRQSFFRGQPAREAMPRRIEFKQLVYPSVDGAILTIFEPFE